MRTERPRGIELLHRGKGRDDRRGFLHARTVVTHDAGASQKICDAQPAENRPARPVGSTWQSPAAKSPSAVGVGLPIMMAPAVVMASVSYCTASSAINSSR